MRRLDEERTRLLKELVVAEKRGEERETGKPTIPTFSIVEMSAVLTTFTIVCVCVNMCVIVCVPHFPNHHLPPLPLTFSLSLSLCLGKKQRDEIRSLESQLVEARRREVDSTLSLSRQVAGLEEKLGEKNLKIP